MEPRVKETHSTKKERVFRVSRRRVGKRGGGKICPQKIGEIRD